MSGHPEPPKNSPYFDKYSDDMGWRYNFIWDKDGSFAWLSDPGPYREVIAHTARCWWLDKQSAIYKFVQDEGRVHLRYGIEDEPEYEEFEKCGMIAEAWRVWGEKK